MIEQTEIDYCRSRETEERAAADRASDPAIRDAHFMLAERYADRAWSIAEGNLNPPPAA